MKYDNDWATLLLPLFVMTVLVVWHPHEAHQSLQGLSQVVAGLIESVGHGAARFASHLAG
jgi:hypothetical protein